MQCIRSNAFFIIFYSICLGCIHGSVCNWFILDSFWFVCSFFHISASFSIPESLWRYHWSVWLCFKSCHSIQYIMYFEANQQNIHHLLGVDVYTAKTSIESDICTRKNSINIEFLFFVLIFVFASFQMKITMSVKQKNAYRIFLGMNNVTVDLCAYFGGSLSSAIMNVFFKDLKEHTNLFHPCPFSVNFLHIFQFRKQMDTLYAQIVRQFVFKNLLFFVFFFFK